MCINIYRCVYIDVYIQILIYKKKMAHDRSRRRILI